MRRVVGKDVMSFFVLCQLTSAMIPLVQHFGYVGLMVLVSSPTGSCKCCCLWSADVRWKWELIKVNGKHTVHSQCIYAKNAVFRVYFHYCVKIYQNYGFKYSGPAVHPGPTLRIRTKSKSLMVSHWCLEDFSFTIK